VAIKMRMILIVDLYLCCCGNGVDCGGCESGRGDEEEVREPILIRCLYEITSRDRLDRSRGGDVLNHRVLGLSH
jgi:hypothetical protein